MTFFVNKVYFFLLQFLLLIIDFANLFLSDILMFELSTGLSFDFNSMLHNIFFWIMLSMHILHILISGYLTHKNINSDKLVEQAIAKEQIKLLSAATKEVKNGDFEKADHVLKVYDKLAIRRKK